MPTDTWEKLEAEATAGPWTHDGPGGVLSEPQRCYIFGGETLVADYPRGPEAQADANAALIVFFRNRSPQLRAVVEAAREAAMHTQHGTVVDFLAIARLAAALRALDEVT